MRSKLTILLFSVAACQTPANAPIQDQVNTVAPQANLTTLFPESKTSEVVPPREEKAPLKMLSKLEATQAIRSCDPAALPRQVPAIHFDVDLIMTAVESGCGEVFTTHQSDETSQLFTITATETTLVVDRCLAYLKGEIGAMHKQVEVLRTENVTDERGLKIGNGMGICEGLARLACTSDSVPSMCRKSDKIHAMLNELVAIFARRDRVLAACTTYYKVQQMEPDLASLKKRATSEDYDAVHAATLELAEHKHVLKDDSEAYRSDFGRQLDFRQCPASTTSSLAH